MNPGIGNDTQQFDRHLHELHAAALDQVSPATLARLRAARHGLEQSPKRGHGWRWAAATAFSAVLAVAIGVRFLPGTAPTAMTPAPLAAGAGAGAEGEYPDSLSTLDENPDLYLWLASSEAEPLAME
ncbi:MAG: hypothetical protein EOP91_03820 [Lysobacteraceae bacterium]|nr:MAG: hypothetical protein EOP91_03820 [Xanthomonadaceae bacterium]